MIKVIKTLEHTQKLFIPKDRFCLAVKNYTFDKFSTLESAKLIGLKEIKYSEIIKYLSSFPPNSIQFEKVNIIENILQFSLKGDAISIWLPAYDVPVRLEFFGEDLEKMYTFDLLTSRKIDDLSFLLLLNQLTSSVDDLFDVKIYNQTAVESKIEKILFTNKILKDISKLHEDVVYLETDFVFPEMFYGNEDLIKKSIESYINNGFEVIVKSKRFDEDRVTSNPHLPSFVKEGISTAGSVQPSFGKEGEFNPSAFETSAPYISHSRGVQKIVVDDGSGLKTKTNKDLLLVTRSQFLGEMMLNQKLSTSSQALDSHSFSHELGSIVDIPVGFVSNELKLVYLTDRELYGSISIERRSNIKNSPSVDKLLKQLEGEIQVDDYVVHEDYGLGIYRGLKQEKVNDVYNDYLLIEFDNKDELYVPILQINKITKYIGTEGLIPKLTRLGRGIWSKTKSEVRKSVFTMAKDMVKHFAKRELSKSEPMDLKDSKAYLEFEKSFAYELTPDQVRSINEIFADLSGTKPMNRLLVGDVGFGKTEVIMRTAFKVLENGGQVLVIAPTTVLAAQHLDVFRERWVAKNSPLNSFKKGQKLAINKTAQIFERIENEQFTPNPLTQKVKKTVQDHIENVKQQTEIACVSRFNSVKQNREIINKFNSGDIKILIGTHRLLSSDVKPKNLKLLVVDEEQKFGVRQKEKLKQINYSVHVLSVTATPIPRTLSLALSSIQDISIIATPPKNRKPVHTEIVYDNWIKVANAIQNELSRGGQVYFVHNRIQTIDSIAAKLKEYIPDLRFEIAHGSVSSNRLDKVITDFYLHKFDVLLSTSIIENGLDIPNVNTIIIHDSHTFGLSQLYQMRGRVGRSDRQAYCYLMCPKPVETLNNNFNNIIQTEAMRDGKFVNDKKYQEKLYIQRLNSLVENQDLGAGFRIASKDLEIRGAGNILGEQQHGHISKIGYGLYIQMLAEEIEMLKKEMF